MPRPENWRGSDMRARGEVAFWLKQHGGRYEQSDGLIVGRMRADLGKGRALSQLLADMEADGMIRREINGRRTMFIELLDDWGLADDLSSQPVFRPPTAPVQSEVNSEQLDYDELAQRLLTLVLSQTRSNASGAADSSRIKQQLADMKAERDQLRKRLAEVTDERDAAVRDADTMRQSLIDFEAAATKPKRGSGVSLRDALSTKDRGLLDRLMREVPTGR